MTRDDGVYKEDGDDTDDGDGDAMEMVKLLQGEIEKKFWRMPSRKNL